MSRVRPPTPSARRAYNQTEYDLGERAVRIGQRLDAWPFRARAMVLISACNPSGRRLPEGVNRKSMARLRACLSAYDLEEGYGHWRYWGEAFFAAAMPLAQARVVAMRFGQNAVVHVEQGRRARLVWLHA